MLIEKLERAGALFPTEVLKRGECLIKPGETEKYIYFIEEGAARIFFVYAGEEFIARLAYSGELITALDSFLSDQPTDFYIEVIRQTHIRRVLKSDYTALIRSDESLAGMWEELLKSLVLEQMEREKDLLIPSPAKRYERVVSRSPRLFQEVPLKYIASYLRMTPETLSRILKS